MPGFFSTLRDVANRSIRVGQASGLVNQGTKCLDSYLLSSDLSDLDEAIQVMTEAADTIPENVVSSINNDMQLYLWTRLGFALHTRYDRMGDSSDLDLAIHFTEKAYAKASYDSPKRADILVNYSSMLLNRYQKQHDSAGLDKAVKLATEAFNLPSQDPYSEMARQAALCGVLAQRYNRDGDIDDLEKSIALGRKALKGRVDHSDHTVHEDTISGQSRVINYLAISLSNRFKLYGKVKDVEEAIDLSEKAWKQLPGGHPDKFQYMNNLGGMFHDKYRRTGSLMDLESAISYIEIALEELSVDKDPSGRGSLLGNLSTCMGQMYRRVGDLHYLEKAIRYGREAVKLIPLGDDHRANILFSNGNCLAERFERIGAMEDLETAIITTKDALTGLNPHQPQRELCADGLSTFLLLKYHRTHDLKDLNDCIYWGEDAQKVSQTKSQFSGSAAMNLSCALWNRSRRDDSTVLPNNDLEKALVFAQKALDLMPPGHPVRAYAFTGLGQCFESKFDKSGRRDDLDKAILAAEKALQCATPNQPERATILHHLGTRFLTKYATTRDVHDLKQGRRFLTDAANIDCAPPMIRVASAKTAGISYSVTHDWSQALTLLELAVDLLPRLSPRIISNDDQQQLLSEISGVSSLAASVALEAGEPPSKALVLLEAGRTMMASMTIRTRCDEADLKKCHPVLHQKYVSRRNALAAETLRSQSPDVDIRSLEAEAAVTIRLKDLEELERIEEEVRRLPGFSGFQLPLQPEDFMGLAIHGPIVVYNVTMYRRDAFIVTSNDTRVIRLENHKMSDIEAKMSLLIHPKRQNSPGHVQTPAQRNDEVSEVLKWLWEFCVRPVLKELNLMSPNANGRLPRIWWVTSGLLGLAPLHAAGEKWGECSENTSSHVVSSYIPSFRALRYSREKAMENLRLTEERFLGVCMPNTPEVWTPLPLIFEKLLAIQAKLKNAGIASWKDSPLQNPSKEDVLSALKNCSIAHFGCHGLSNSSDPSSSCLILKDKTKSVVEYLSVRDLRAEHLIKAELAYLSACSTAENSSEALRDESIHLGSAFQLIGFPHVIATLWEANVDSADHMAGLFYKHWILKKNEFADSRDVCAYALHDAVAELWAGPVKRGRKLKNQGLNVTGWAPFVHIGC